MKGGFTVAGKKKQRLSVAAWTGTRKLPAHSQPAATAAKVLQTQHRLTMHLRLRSAEVRHRGPFNCSVHVEPASNHPHLIRNPQSSSRNQLNLLRTLSSETNNSFYIPATFLNSFFYFLNQLFVCESS